MTLLDDFRRVTKLCPCPICEHPDWCLISRDDPPSRVICSRTESKQRWGEAGWLHVLRNDGRPFVRTRKLQISARRPDPNLRRLADDYQARLRPGQIARFADSLGVTSHSLWRLGVGWDGRCWTFPMSDAGGAVVGIRLRTPSGRKFAVPGSKQGLFIPTDLTCDGPLFITEGPTDTAAALDLGFDAVGRPSCRGGTRLLVEYVKRHNPDSVVIVADADVAGRGGADDLAAVLVCYCRDVRVIEPPSKDLRDWCRAGAASGDIQAAYERAVPGRLGVRRRGGV